MIAGRGEDLPLSAGGRPLRKRPLNGEVDVRNPARCDPPGQLTAHVCRVEAALEGKVHARLARHGAVKDEGFSRTGWHHRSPQPTRLGILAAISTRLSIILRV